MRAKRIYESPDEIALPDLKYNSHGEAIDSNRWAPAFGDKGSYPFWYENGEFVLGNEYSGHPTTIRGDQESFSGRVWADRKLISFWIYPSKTQFIDIAKELSERLDKKGYDADILSDPEWKVEILPLDKWRGHLKGFQTKLVPAKDYEESRKRGEFDLGQEHLKSPMDPTKKSPPKYIKKRDIRMRYAMGENKLVPERLEQLFEFERTGDPKRGMAIGIEAAKQALKKEIGWEISDSKWDGPGMLRFSSNYLNELWDSRTEVQEIAIKELMEEFLSGKKKWRTRGTIYHLHEILHDLGMLFDPKYMVLNPQTWETIGHRYPEEAKEFALKYFKPNQVYSVGVNYQIPEMMKEGIKMGATNLDIKGTEVFEIPLIADDGELLQLLLDKSGIDPGEMFTVTKFDYGDYSNSTERDESNKALRMAAKHGKINTFKVLFNDSRSDPSATNNFALKWAIKGGHWDIVDILLTDERVREKAYLLPKNAQQKLKDSGLAKEYGLFESVNFERGKDPQKAMGIGKHSKDLKVHRCGACGTPTDEYGHELKYGSPEFQRTVDIIEDMNDTTTKQTWCSTCANDAAREQEEAEARYEAETEWQEEQWRQEHGY